MESEKLLRTIIVHSSADEVEALIKVLRNSGFAVRATHAEGAEDVEDALKEKEFDLIFCALEFFGGEIADVVDVLKRTGGDEILIGFGDATDLEQATAAMLAGATSIVSHAYPQHLALIVSREMRHLSTTRDLAHTRALYLDSERRARVLLDTSRDAIAYVHEGMHIYANPAYLKLFGFNDLDDVEGLPIMDLITSDDHQRLKESLRTARSVDSKSLPQIETTALASGREFKVSMEFARASFEEEPCIQIVFHDHTLQRQLAAQVRDLKKRDPVTDLLNRRAFLDEVRKAFKSRQSETGLLYLDLDSVNSIRDAVGLSGLDSILRDIGQLLESHSKENAIIARFSDQVFTILVDTARDSDAQNLAETYRQAVEGHIAEIDGHSVALTCSIGCTLLRYCKDDYLAAIHCVERACATAKADGGNAAHFINPLVEGNNSEDDIKWVKLVRDALKENRFRLLYQPIANLQGGSAEQYDVLLRLVNEKGDLVSPELFFGAAQRFGLSGAIDRWVMANALNVMGHRRKAGRNTRLFVKLSDASIVDAKLPAWIIQRMKAFSVAPSQMILAISERDAATHLKEARQLIQIMRKLGCQVALDRFSGEQNQVHVLKHLDVNYLKISREIITQLTDSEEAMATLQFIAGLVEETNITLIATGVEDPGALQGLYMNGVKLIQGDFLQEPDTELSYDFVGEVLG